MKYNFLLSLSIFLILASSVDGKRKDFILQSGQTVSISCDNSEEQVVHTALEILRRDIRAVLSAPTNLNIGKAEIIIATIGGQYKAIEQTGVDVSVLKRKKQAFLIAVSPEGKLVVAGSDNHGTAFGIRDFPATGCISLGMVGGRDAGEKGTFRTSF